ncbi:MAG: hypothetical protein ACRD9W_10095, partial [Terriglobia bacterium]
KMIGVFDAVKNATPLSPEERDGLIPTHITLRSELNELEQKNSRASRWLGFSSQTECTRRQFP